MYNQYYISSVIFVSLITIYCCKSHEEDLLSEVHH